MARKRKNVQELALAETPVGGPRADTVIGDGAAEAIDVPTADVVTLDSYAGAADLSGAFVKLAPVLAAAERAGFDAEAARRIALDAGAKAVIVAPTYEVEQRGGAPRGSGVVDAREQIRAWFSASSDADAAAALDACLRIADEVGL